MQGIELFDVLLTSGFITTLLGLYVKWRHDKKKAPLEREAVLATASQQNVTDALAISAEARATAQAVRTQYTEDRERDEARHRAELDALRERSDRDLTALRERLDGLDNANRELNRKVSRLERDDEIKGERIGKLEKNLNAAKDTVVKLMQYIRDHTTDTGTIPTVDYTIFDR